ncbi:hypothetical protein O6H91_18G073200 [Diphasiastrum complanatum]|uniref:Uncharacterized protein n=1 Tax=Diphasiastrum complanatum TaxID=34168 RepID=A0ACC2B2R9_DIPCM|nr:hypothetical protein O6H91_18G073200 [Diphasiastrum complanatum]
MDGLVVMGTGTSPSQKTLSFGRGLTIKSPGFGKLSSLGIAVDSISLSPLSSAIRCTGCENKSFRPSTDAICFCSHPEEVKLEAGKGLVGNREERRKKTSNIRRKSVHLPAAVINPSNTITFAEDQINLENATATLEQIFRESFATILESPYEKPSCEPYIHASQYVIRKENNAASSEQILTPQNRDLHSWHDNWKESNHEPVSDKSEELFADLNHPLSPKNEMVTRVRNRRKGGRKLNLVSRIALQKTRLEKIVKPAGRERITRPRFSGVEKSDLWSDEADQLVKMYGKPLDMRAVNWFNLPHGRLTAQEEIRLSNLFKPLMRLQELALALKEHLGREPLDKEWSKAAKMDLQTLRRHLQLGRAARNKIIQHNLRLVVHQANKYYKGEMSLSLFDLCQEGVRGLVRAIEKFNPNKGVRFCTYAVYWIRNGILRAQTRLGHFLRAPYNVALHRMNIKNASMDLTMKYEREPTPAEIMQQVGLGTKRYHNILKTSTRIGSLHERSRITGEERIHVVSDSDDAETQFLKSTAGAMLRFGMDDVLDSLKKNENLVIRQRYGLDGKGERSFSEIGMNLNLSREMVRKYEIRGILKLRSPHRLKYLRGLEEPSRRGREI